MENNVKRNLIRVFVKGGFLSPADLLRIMEVSRTLGNKYIMFGSRQDIMFPSNGADDQVLQEAFSGIGIEYEHGSDQSVYQNIVSAYASVNVTECTGWVKEDTYNVLIDAFDYKPRSEDKPGGFRRKALSRCLPVSLTSSPPAKRTIGTCTYAIAVKATLSNAGRGLLPVRIFLNYAARSKRSSWNMRRLQQRSCS